MPDMRTKSDTIMFNFQRSIGSADTLVHCLVRVQNSNTSDADLGKNLSKTP